MSEIIKQPGNKIAKKVQMRQRIIAVAVFLLTTAFFVMGIFFARGVIDPERLFGICGFWQRYHLPCPTCGFTRSIMAFCEGNIAGAFYVQPAAGVLSLTAFLGWICSFLTVLGVDLGFIYCRIASLRFRYIFLAIIIILLGGWAVTLSRALVKW